MAIDYEALFNRAYDAGVVAPGDKYDDQAAATVIRDAFTAELAEHKERWRATDTERREVIADRDRAIAKVQAERDASKAHIIKDARDAAEAHQQLRDDLRRELADRDRTIAERDAEIARLRDMASSAIDLADGLHEGHDYLGTGSDSKSADKEYASDAKRIADFRAALGDRHHD